MNSKPRCILCATDFSESARRAASVAARWATRSSGELLLVHVAATADEKRLVTIRGLLEAEAQRYREAGATVDARLLREGPVAEAVLNLIGTERPALVVVASAGKGPLDRWTFGSVSEQIAQASPVPTLVVHEAEPFLTWDRLGCRLKILAALDLTTSSDGVLHWVKEFRKTAPCDLTVCHVNWRPAAQGFAELPGGTPHPVNPAHLQERLERELKKKVRDQIGDEDDPIVVRPAAGEPDTAILELAREIRADLIVVGTHQRHGVSRLLHGSISRALLHRGAFNLACVPTTAVFDPREAHIPELRRVLVATDFSDLGNAAIPYACSACAIGGLVKIVHVVPPGQDDKAAAGPAERERLRRKLQGLVPDEVGARAQPPELAVLEENDPAAAICAEAERFGADLVCLASHGLSGSKALFGSVTQAVLKNLRRPFLVVRRPDA